MATSASIEEAQQDEMEALACIYGEAFQILPYVRPNALGIAC